jgi:hypothetical protein
MGNAIGNGPGQSSLSQPASRAAGRHGGARPALLLSFVNDNTSIMPGTCDGFKPENNGMSEHDFLWIRILARGFDD